MNKNIDFVVIHRCLRRRRRHRHRHPFLCFYSISTEIQGELIDSVEHHVESSTDYIKQGHLELKQAEVYQSKARKVPFLIRNNNKNDQRFFYFYCSISFLLSFSLSLPLFYSHFSQLPHQLINFYINKNKNI